MRTKTAYIEPTKFGHIKDIEPFEELEVSRTKDRMLMDLMAGATMYTVFDATGKPLAVVGADVIFPKNLEVYSLADKRVADHFHTYSRSVRLLLDGLFEEKELNRLQMLVNSRYAWAYGWAKFLGLREDARLAKYGENGEEYILFARVRE